MSRSKPKCYQAVRSRFAVSHFAFLTIAATIFLGAEHANGQTTQDELRRRLPVMVQPPTENSLSPGLIANETANWQPISYLQDDDSPESAKIKDVEQLEKRLAVLEEELKKSKEEDAKKKEEDAKKPIVKPRGRLHTDLNYFGQSDLNREQYGDIQDGANIRRARLGFDVKMLEVTEWRLDFEMASGGGRPSIFDAYIRVIELPLVNNLQVGHFREPFSLEAQTSSNWLTFLERSTNNTFDPARNWGIMAFDWSEDERLTWAAGVFRDGSDTFGDDIGDSGEWAGTGRSTYLLQYDEQSKGRCFWEIGGSYSYRDPDQRFALNSTSGPPNGAETSIVNYFLRPEDLLNEDGVGRIPNLLHVSIPDANNVQLFGLETTRNFGSLNIQSEFIAAYVNRDAADDVFYHGAYVQASYFLTGESRRWDPKAGTFGRAEVFAPFWVKNVETGARAGLGAWELVSRWNYLNLSDGNVGTAYGEGNSTTLGLNWYLNPYAYLQFNYDYTVIPDGGPDTGGNVHTYHMRWNVHF